MIITKNISRILEQYHDHRNKDDDDDDKENSPTFKAIVIVLSTCIGIIIIAGLICCYRYFKRIRTERRAAQIRQQTELAYQSQNIQLEQQEQQQNQSCNSNIECPICLVFIPSEFLINTQCSHQYHKACLDKWILVNNQCPVCRMVLTSSPQE